MKKLFIVAITALGFTFAAQAQDVTSANGGFENGDVFISGSVGFGSEKTGDLSSNVFNIAPKVGFFVSENIAVGAQIGYTSYKNENDGTDVLDTNEFSAGVFGRYYFTPMSQFSVFAELGVDLNSGKDKLNDSKYNGFGLDFAPGISYFVSNNFAIEASIGVLGYSTSKPDFDGADSTNNFNLGLNLNDVLFGIVYKF